MKRFSNPFFQNITSLSVKNKTGDIMKKSAEYILIFSLGAILYNLIEVLFRGYTHWSMSIAGGIAVLILYVVDIKLPSKSILLRGLIGCLTITGIEFIAGCIVNIWLKLNVWDYSDLLLNFLGQICLPFSSIWFLISFPAILVCRFIRKHMIAGEESKSQFEEI